MSEITLINNAIIQGAIPRKQIMQLEEAIKKMPVQVNLTGDTYHHFAPGVYLRELFIPAGVVITGAIHRTKHLTIVANGTVRITTPNGVEEITGPRVFVSEAGTKKAILAITDATIMNPLPTTETDVDKIEEHFTAPSYDALENIV